MTERAAHLVEQVFPAVAVRQWVLSLPHRLRYLLAWDHDLCRAVVAAYLRGADARNCGCEISRLLDRAGHRRGTLGARLSTLS